MYINFERGSSSVGKGIFRQIEKGTDGAIAHAAAAPFKIDVHGGLDHTHNGEGLGFQALRQIAFFQEQGDGLAHLEAFAGIHPMLYQTFIFLFRPAAFLEHRHIDGVLIVLGADFPAPGPYQHGVPLGRLHKGIHRIGRGNTGDILLGFQAVHILSLIHIWEENR